MKSREGWYKDHLCSLSSSQSIGPQAGLCQSSQFYVCWDAMIIAGNVLATCLWTYLTGIGLKEECFTSAHNSRDTDH